MSVIELHEVSKSYGGRVVVDAISLRIQAGEIFGILGPNGSGKTTTVECIGGLRRPDAGTIDVLGLDPQRDHRRLRHVLGMQLQESRLPDKLRVWEAVDLYRSFYESPADGETLLSQLGLAEQRRTPFAKLSGGQQQRLSIALALVGRPQVAILDELTAGLDPQGRRDTWELIRWVRDQGVTILLVTHFMEEAERLCDRLAVIDRGRLVALDTPAGLISDAGNEQHLTFVPSSAIDENDLLALAEVTEVRRRGDQVVVTGTGAVVSAVTTRLARDGVSAEGLRVEQRSLEDAFVALTGRRLDEMETGR